MDVAIKEVKEVKTRKPKNRKTCEKYATYKERLCCKNCKDRRKCWRQ